MLNILPMDVRGWTPGSSPAINRRVLIIQGPKTECTYIIDLIN